MSRYCTPLRYPGGKQKLTPFVLEILEANGGVGGHYVEPYAGGAGVAIELLMADKVSHIHLNDSSIHIYSFWNSVLRRSDELCDRILRASLTVDEWKIRREVVRNPHQYDELEVGFSTFYLNRCNRSGVLSGGVIGGLDQSGEWKIDARFPRNELVRRIENIASRRKQISLKNWDAEKFIRTYLPRLPQETYVYCDPPYYEKADRLYLNGYQKKDHQRLSAVIQGQATNKWFVSYDRHDEIIKFYEGRRHFVYDLQYSAARARLGKEIFIFSDELNIPRASRLKFIDVALDNFG